MAKITGMAHIGVFVKDIARSTKFYNDVLGFETIWTCDVPEADGTLTGVAFVKLNDICLELICPANPPERVDGTVDHIAMAVDDIEAVAQQLREKGIEFESKEIVYCDRVFPKGAKWILFRGPDNEHLELNQVM